MEEFGNMATMLVMIPVVYICKEIEWTPERVLIIRVLFGLVQAGIIIVLLLTQSRINKKADQSKIQAPKAPTSVFTPSYVVILIFLNFYILRLVI